MACLSKYLNLTPGSANAHLCNFGLNFVNFTSLPCKAAIKITSSVMGCYEDEMNCYPQSTQFSITAQRHHHW